MLCADGNGWWNIAKCTAKVHQINIKICCLHFLSRKNSYPRLSEGLTRVKFWLVLILQNPENSRWNRRWRRFPSTCSCRGWKGTCCSSSPSQGLVWVSWLDFFWENTNLTQCKYHTLRIQESFSWGFWSWWFCRSS